MRVVLFRHGPAGKRDPERWPDDALRPLTSRGIGRTRDAAAGVVRLERGLSRILTSPLQRAAETAEILAEVCEAKVPIETFEALAAGRSFRAILQRLAAIPAEETVALVGHEPDLGKLAGVLLIGAPAALPLKKAGACAVAFEGPVAPGDGRLEWFLPPGALRRHVRHLRKPKAKV
jgi:phosphohistidine phosphatase